ncbi:MAG: type II toxin-antitoxin system ParD family antitoxin [Acetobacteraceae bacterium]
MTSTAYRPGPVNPGDWRAPSPPVHSSTSYGRARNRSSASSICGALPRTPAWRTPWPLPRNGPLGPAEQASYIDAQVAKGAYASASEVVRAGLRALQERDAATERWLRDEVVPAY